MNLRQTLTVGTERFVVRPWHVDSSIAYLTMLPEQPRPSAAGIAHCLERLGTDGYLSVITSALHPEEAHLFLAAGFEEFDRLSVLVHLLEDLDPPRPVPAPTVGLRRGRRADRRSALSVDAAAFPPLWQLDGNGFDEAMHATPTSRFRVAVAQRQVVGYAVTGRAGRQGFLQRLATHPGHCGRGVGSSLVVDALTWAARRRSDRLLVNTQKGNERALDLYLRLGFELTPTELVVLTRPVP
jgi:ribosomal protein S18 acetylase RimI-like enzyme